jgi:hypothetical protein
MAFLERHPRCALVIGIHLKYGTEIADIIFGKFMLRLLNNHEMQTAQAIFEEMIKTAKLTFVLKQLKLTDTLEQLGLTRGTK